jgi:transcriptional regulator with XRE-family HTH domain
MAQTTALINTLKRTLKAHGKTYVDVGRALELSEASVKRLFSREDFSLERLDRICQLIGIEITDLVELMNAEQRQLEQLTLEQEQELVDDKTLLAVAICALNKWTMDEIVSFYDITEGQCFQKLARLDKLKLIDLLPHNRIKILVAPNFRWQENGPIQKLFQERLGNEFLHGKFKGEDESLIVFNGMLSKHNIAELKNKLRRLAWELNVANREDSSLPLAERHGITAVLAVRGWQYGLFHPLRSPLPSGTRN